MKDYETKLKEKQDYGTGATRDNSENKGRFDLIPDLALVRLVGVYERGAANHGPRNWEQGLPMSRLIDSSLRHLIQYKMSKYMSEFDDEDHLAHSAWNILAIIHTEEMIKRGSLPQELDDLPRYEKIEKNSEMNLRDVLKLEDELKPFEVTVHVNGTTMKVCHLPSGYSVTKYEGGKRENYAAALLELKAILVHTGDFGKKAKLEIEDEFDFGDDEKIFEPEQKCTNDGHNCNSTSGKCPSHRAGRLK